MAISAYINLTNFLVLLVPLYLYICYNNMHALISPLTHSSNSELLRNTPVSQLIAPIIPPSTSFTVSFAIETQGGRTVTLPTIEDPRFVTSSDKDVDVILPLSDFITDNSRDAAASPKSKSILELGLFVTLYNYVNPPEPNPAVTLNMDVGDRAYILEALHGQKLVTLKSTFCFEGRPVCVDEKAKLVVEREYKPKPSTRRLYERRNSETPIGTPITPAEMAHLPHFIPVHSLNLIADPQSYPRQLASHLVVRRLDSNALVHLPTVFMNNLIQTADDYIPLLPPGSTIGGPTNMMLTVTIKSNTSPARYRLMQHLSSTLRAQQEWGFAEEDIDDVRRLITDTSMAFLAMTVTASTLHMLFEFLAFKEDISFWSNTKSIRGLSLRALVSDFVCQVILALFMQDNGASVLVVIPQMFAIVVAAWKIKRAFGVNVTFKGLRPTFSTTIDTADELTLDLDRQATGIVVKIVVPLVCVYGVYTFAFDEHAGWYSYSLAVASAAVYSVGFIMMFPQLFLNYRLKSVAHLPFRVLGYRFFNTIIDDIFACVLRMPTMTRLACFRDDIVFVIYLWQRHTYAVDYTRPSEGGGMVGQGVDAGEASGKALGKAKNKKETKKQK